MNKTSDARPGLQMTGQIGDLYGLLNQFSGELVRTDDQQRRFELIDDIKDLHKQIKRVEMSLLKQIHNRH